MSNPGAPPLKQNVPRKGEASGAPSARLSALTWRLYVSVLFPRPLCPEPGATQVADETGHKLTPPEGAGRERVSHRAGQCRLSPGAPEGRKYSGIVSLKR